MLQRTESTPSISCVVPAYNEAASLADTLGTMLATLRPLFRRIELIVVDDGSKDDTAAIVERLGATNPEIVLLRLSRNFGKEAALTAGMEAAAGDLLLFVDADGQHPPDMVAPMLQGWRDGADVVYGVRRVREDQSRLHRRMIKTFYRLINWGSPIEIPAGAGDFRLMDRKVVEALKALPERNRFMKGFYAWVGFKSLPLDYEPLPRSQGRTHFGIKGAFRLAMTGMLAFSTAPLRALSVVGFLLALASLAYGAWVIFEYFYYGIAAPGFATIVVAMMFLSGIQLLSVGVLAEYVGRIYDEVKRRPVYLVSERQGQGLAAAPGPVPAPHAPLQAQR
ncbi:glycosyltransferase family 2 protein [Caenimonas terrae]|uniref:Glycosyltransferase family 2 protein n=1 Tax=Caenimonas terrae TaxID=696074 RepID=A0ABW0NHY9_9BURK